MKHYFIHSDWQALFKQHEIDNFAALWALQNQAADEPNYSANGFSQVSKMKLALVNGESANFYMKKQLNYTCKTILHPLKGIPTFRRELKNMIRFNKANIDTVVPIFYAEQVLKHERRAILITKALDNYISLKDWLAELVYQPLKRDEKIAIMKKMAVFIRHLHQKFRHGCLFTKHIFLHFESDRTLSHLCVIDLEKVHQAFFAPNRAIRDLSQLYRSQQSISKIEAIRFMKFYLNVTTLDENSKKIIRRLAAHIKRKK